MTSRSEITHQVEGSAAGRCEYCRMHQPLQGATFHVEHIIPRSLGGSSALNNLAWACPSCNLQKSNRVLVLATETPEEVRLFDPRAHEWTDHFRWAGYHIIGLTKVGRVTVEALLLNHQRRTRIRPAEELFGLFPPIEQPDIVGIAPTLGAVPGEADVDFSTRRQLPVMSTCGAKNADREVRCACRCKDRERMKRVRQHVPVRPVTQRSVASVISRTSQSLFFPCNQIRTVSICFAHGVGVTEARKRHDTFGRPAVYLMPEAHQ